MPKFSLQKSVKNYQVQLRKDLVDFETTPILIGAQQMFKLNDELIHS